MLTKLVTQLRLFNLLIKLLHFAADIQPLLIADLWKLFLDIDFLNFCFGFFLILRTQFYGVKENRNFPFWQENEVNRGNKKEKFYSHFHGLD